MTELPFVNDDGGSSRYRWEPGTCVPRALAIVTGRPYWEIRTRLIDGLERWAVKHPPKERPVPAGWLCSTGWGVCLGHRWVKRYLSEDLGLTFHASVTLKTARSGDWLTLETLPLGRLFVCVPHHALAMIDGVAHDTKAPGVGEAVQGFWSLGNIRARDSVS